MDMEVPLVVPVLASMAVVSAGWYLLCRTCVKIQLMKELKPESH